MRYDNVYKSEVYWGFLPVKILVFTKNAIIIKQQQKYLIFYSTISSLIITLYIKKLKPNK
jgi:hypothetical protein